MVYKPVVDPNVAGCLNANAISICGEDVLADDVANDHIGLFPDEQSNPDEFCRKVSSLTRLGVADTYWLLEAQ